MRAADAMYFEVEAPCAASAGPSAEEAQFPRDALVVICHRRNRSRRENQLC